MRIITRTLTAAALLAATSCSSTVRSGNSPVFLVIDSLAGIRGGPTAGTASSILISDVQTLVTNTPTCTQTNPCPFVFGDNGTATLELAKKDVTSTTPTTNNQVTINRVHIHYRFADGSGVQGSTVPTDIDSFVTATVPTTGSVTVGFELVRVDAKVVAPLLALRSGGQLSIVADVTIIGKDQVGNDISVMGSIQIAFGNWADS